MTTSSPAPVDRRPSEEGPAVPGATTTRTTTTRTTAVRPTGAGDSAAPALPSAPGPTGADALAELPCRQHPADLWFAELPHEVEQAKDLCGACPIRSGCLAGALRRAEPWGVWGGQLILQGRVVPRKRPRGRPRKDEVAA